MSVMLFYTANIMFTDNYKMSKDLYNYLVNRVFENKARVGTVFGNDIKYSKISDCCCDDICVFFSMLGYKGVCTKGKYFISDIRMLSNNILSIDFLTDDYDFAVLHKFSKSNKVSKIQINTYGSRIDNYIMIPNV